MAKKKKMAADMAQAAAEHKMCAGVFFFFLYRACVKVWGQ